MNTSSLIRHTLIALRVSLTSLRRRWWGSLNAVIGSATVVGMLVVILSIGAGYSKALRLASSSGNVLIMRAGARSEMESTLTAQQVTVILGAPLIARTASGRPAAGGEVYAIANIGSRASGQPMNVAVRGVQASSLPLRAGLKLVQGRMFEPGHREIVVGRRALEQFRGLDLDARFEFAGAAWTVVGVFEDGGGLVESEVWADLNMVQAAYQRGNGVQLVIARLLPGATPRALEEAINRDARLGVTVVTEKAYYEEQAGQMRRFVQTLGYGMAFLMGLGAVFAALNTGYACVAARAKELATLGALGSDERALMASVVIESFMLALLGGAGGVLAAYMIFDGRVISTLFFSKDFSQVVFAFSVSGAVLAQGAIGASLIGTIGAIGPALHAWRLPLARVLADRR